MDLKELRPGTVEIELEGWGRPLKLVPSLDAAMSLNRRYGGFGPLTDKVRAYDLDVFVAIIAAGAKVTEAGLARLPDCVWQTGMFNLVVPLTKFCAVLANGDRPVTVETGEDGASEPADPS